MWAVRALARFLLGLAIAVVIGLAVAALWALAHGGSFRHSVVVGFFAIGAVLMLLGAVGQSTADRTVFTDQTAGRIPGMPAWAQSKPGDVSVRPGALLFLAGLVLIGIGIGLDATVAPVNR